MKWHRQMCFVLQTASADEHSLYHSNSVMYQLIGNTLGDRKYGKECRGKDRNKSSEEGSC